MKINNIPKLESTDRLKAEDLTKFFAWKEVIQIFMDGLNLLDIIQGKTEVVEEVQEPTEEIPSRVDILEAKRNNDKELIKKYLETTKRWKIFEKYRKKMKEIKENEKKAMVVLIQALGPYSVVKFKVNHSQKDTAHDLWNRINDYFLQDSALIINNIEKTLRAIRMEPNEKIDALADRMKNHTSHLRALGVEMKDAYLKETLIHAIQESKQARKYQTIILNIVGEINYKEYNFDTTVQKFTNMEGYLKDFREQIQDKTEKDEDEKEKEIKNETAALFVQNQFGLEGGRGRGRGIFTLGDGVVEAAVGEGLVEVTTNTIQIKLIKIKKIRIQI